MEQRFTIECKVFVAAPEGADPEHIAQDMDMGLDRALASFPGGEVTGAAVEFIRPANKEEQGLYFEE